MKFLEDLRSNINEVIKEPKKWHKFVDGIDNYDISMKFLEDIKDEEILKEEYKHTLSRMLNFEKFMKEKVLLFFISSIGAIIAFGFTKITKTKDIVEVFQYLDLILYGLVGLLIGISFLLLLTNKINKDLKKRKEKIINLLNKDQGESIVEESPSSHQR